jgi:UDP-glucose 4-epimerase
VTRVLVTGAAGAIGPSVVRALVVAGSEVRALIMDTGDRSVLPAGVETVMGDLTDSTTIPRAVQGMETVVHLAGLVHRTRIPPELVDRYRQVNVDATRQLVSAAMQHGVRHFVFASTIAVYPCGLDGPATEDTPPIVTSLYTETKLAAEQAVLAARRANGVACGTVLRLAAVYGPRVKGNYNRLVRALASRRFVPVGGGGNHRTLVYVDDVARAIVLALDHPSALGRIFNVCDERSYAMRDIVRSICDALGRTPPTFAVPESAARLGAWMAEAAFRSLGREAPVDRRTVEKYLEHVAVSGQRLEREVGFRPTTSLHDGWHATVAAMRAAGELPVVSPRHVA